MAQLDIDVKQGATYQILLTITDADSNPIDLTGYTFRGQIRKSISDSDIQANFSFNVLTQSGGTLGQVECSISAEDTAAIDVPSNNQATRRIIKMAYDIESETASGEVTRWLEGIANISPEVTR